MKLWIARDENGELCLYRNLPELVEIKENTNEKFWQDSSNDGYYCYLDNSEFSEITFENSPQEVELKLVSEIVGVAESPLKTFPRVNEFEVGASYRR